MTLSLWDMKMNIGVSINQWVIILDNWFTWFTSWHETTVFFHEHFNIAKNWIKKIAPPLFYWIFFSHVEQHLGLKICNLEKILPSLTQNISVWRCLGSYSSWTVLNIDLFGGGLITTFTHFLTNNNKSQWLLIHLLSFKPIKQ